MKQEDFSCCGGSDENPPEHTQDCETRTIWQGEVNGKNYRIYQIEVDDLVVEELSSEGDWSVDFDDDAIANQVLIKALLQADTIIRAVQETGRKGLDGNNARGPTREWRTRKPQTPQSVEEIRKRVSNRVSKTTCPECRMQGQHKLQCSQRKR